MANKGMCRRMTLAYPRHRFQPEDLLNFIESTEFTAQWRSIGLDDEDDLWSLQTCTMARPLGDGKIDGTGIRYHTHVFHRQSGVKRVTIYYGYFRDYGIVYLSCFDETEIVVDFTAKQRWAIKKELDKVLAELDRLRSIRVSR